MDVAKKAVLELLDTMKHTVDTNDREMLRMVARTSLRTKARACGAREQGRTHARTRQPPPPPHNAARAS